MAYLKVFLLSAAPVAEIRGGIPYGVYLGLSGGGLFYTIQNSREVPSYPEKGRFFFYWFSACPFSSSRGAAAAIQPPPWTNKNP